MATTLQQLIDRAVSIASRGQESSLSPAISSEMIAEDLLTVVFLRVGTEAAGNRRLRSLLRRTKALNVNNGTVALSSDVLTAYIHEGVLVDPADRTKEYSLEPWHLLSAGQLDTRIGHYAIEAGSTLHVVEPGSAYDPASGPTVSLELTVPCIPQVPATAATNIDAIDEVVARLTQELAAALQPLTRAR